MRLVSFTRTDQAEIHEHVLATGIVRRNDEAQRKLFFNLRSTAFGGSNGRIGSRRDRGEAGVKPEEVLEMETRISGGDVSLDPAPATRKR